MSPVAAVGHHTLFTQTFVPSCALCVLSKRSPIALHVRAEARLPYGGRPGTALLEAHTQILSFCICIVESWLCFSFLCVCLLLDSEGFESNDHIYSSEEAQFVVLSSTK